MKPLRYTITIGAKEDLGTRAPMVRTLVDRMRRHRRQQLPTWIHRPDRKRAELFARVSYNPSPVPFRARLLREETFPDFIRRTYRLQINPDDQTEAFLFLPRAASRQRPVPALLGLHEHGGQFLLGKAKLTRVAGMPATFRRYQQLCYGGQPPADFFAANGFAVLVMDQLGFGSRALWKRGEPPYHRGNLRLPAARDLQLRLRMRYEQFALHRALLAHGVTESEICLYDNRRSIDFLETIPAVDVNRLGAFGLSMGAMHCHELAAFDPRVKAAVPVCWTGDWGEMIKRAGPRVLGTQFLLPGINTACHVPELVALTHPRAMLIINGTRDTMYSLANQRRARREILVIARRQGRADRVRWQFFAGPHQFHPPQQRRALEFFREIL